MKKNKCILLLLCFLIFFMSCKNGIKNIKKQNFRISVDFPDTIVINKLYNGKINYKNDLDTVTTKLLDIKKPRFIQYAFLKTKTINYDNKYLKKIVTDTIYGDNNKIIPLPGISFNKLGINYIDGIIYDEVDIDNGAKNENGQSMTRIITNEYRVTFKVIVIER